MVSGAENVPGLSKIPKTRIVRSSLRSSLTLPITNTDTN